MLTVCLRYWYDPFKMILVVNSSVAKGIALSALGRMVTKWQWVCAGEQLGGPSAAPAPPRTSLRFFLFSRDNLGLAGPAATLPAAARHPAPLHKYVVTPESLPEVASGSPRQSLARPERSNFWRWFFTSETLPRTDARPAGGAQSHPKES
jgi:hypothetical protein